jgi:hypothetical protein
MEEVDSVSTRLQLRYLQLSSSQGFGTRAFPYPFRTREHVLITGDEKRLGLRRGWRGDRVRLGLGERRVSARRARAG